MRIVVALGGNALLQRGELMSYENQWANILKASNSLKTIARDHELVIVHGNGPQVGLVALQNESYSEEVPSYPFNILVAESQAMIGSMIGRALKNDIPSKNITTILTQLVVDENDPSFNDPSKFIGATYSEEESIALAKERQWTLKRDGEYYRRVVASPTPKKIIEKEAIIALLKSGGVVIACGGGGIPVIENKNGLQGIDGVIDKDKSACLLAKEIKADMFIILSDIQGVYENFGKPDEKIIHYISPEDLLKMDLPKGSMLPKAQSVSKFVSETGKFSAIGNMESLKDIIEQNKGTIVKKDSDIDYY